MRLMLSIPGSLFFAKMVMTSSAPAKSARELPNTHPKIHSFIDRMSHTILTPFCIRSVFFLRLTQLNIQNTITVRDLQIEDFIDDRCNLSNEKKVQKLFQVFELTRMNLAVPVQYSLHVAFNSFRKRCPNVLSVVLHFV